VNFTVNSAAAALTDCDLDHAVVLHRHMYVTMKLWYVPNAWSEKVNHQTENTRLSDFLLCWTDSLKLAAR